MEENLFRETFGDCIKAEFERFRARRGYEMKLPVFSIWSHIKKENRIYSVEPDISAGKIMFSRFLQQDFISQLESYPNCDRNDGLDALEIMKKIVGKGTGLHPIYFN